MYELTVTFTSSNTINVSANTYWSCEAIGNNFTLSKYSGVGNGVININIPSNIPFADGSVVFAYGDDKCRKKEFTVFENNNNYIVTEPGYFICVDPNNNKEIKTINLFYTEPNEVFYVNVQCFDGWNVGNVSSNVKYVKDDNSVMIISPSDSSNGELTIIPTHHGYDNENNVIVRIINKQYGMEYNTSIAGAN